MENKEYKTLRWMKHLGDEFEYIGTSPLQAKFKIMLLMVYIDIFSQIWGLFIENELSTKSQNERFSKWSDKFIFNSENNSYASRQDEFHLLNGELLYKIRNSILHFGGLPNSDFPIFISTDTKHEFCQKYSRQIGEQEILVLCPKVLFVAVAFACALTVEKISEETESNPDKYQEIVLKLDERLQKESAFPIHVTPPSN